MRRNVLVWLGLLLLCLPIIRPFLSRGYFPTQDGEWAVVRLAEMHRELKDGQFPPRWAGYLNHGYGYPLFLFTYPFPYYLAEFFHLTGFSLISAIKAIFILSVIGSAVCMYFLGRKLWGEGGAWLSVATYLYAPYRMTNLFVRGAIGESLAFVFYPLLLFLIYAFKDRVSWRLILATSLGVAAFLLTHNASVILFAPVLILWIWFVWKDLDRSKRWNFGLSLGLGLLISAHFWLPAIVEKKFIALSATPLADKLSNFVLFQELFLSPWQFSTRPPLLLGFILTILGIVGGIILVRQREQKFNRIRWILVGITLFSFLMLFSISHLLWQLPLLGEIDFPWRMLSVVSFLLALLSGAMALKIKSKLLLIFLILVAVGLNLQYIQTQPMFQKSDEYYATNDATTTSADELMPVWVRKKPANRPEKTFIGFTNSQVTVNKDTAVTKDLTITTRGESLVFNQVYFPGWTAFVDDQVVELNKMEHTGLMSIQVPSGAHTVRFNFTRTPTRIIADILSILGLLALGGYVWKNSSKL